jgi:hypothetical protein
VVVDTTDADPLVMVSSRVRRILVCLCISVSLVGCRAGQLGHDQADMRETLLKLYQDQVLDNLVRTSLNFPIVQVDYNNITGTVQQTASATAGQTITTTRNSFLNATGALLRRVFTYVYNFSATGSEVATMTVTGQPVITTDSIYHHYVDAVAKGVILEVKGPVQDVKHHLVHKFQGKTYYVPSEKADEFFRLYLAVTVQRQTKVPLSLTVQTKILGTVETDSLRHRLLIRLSDRILNDSGQLVVIMKGKETSFNYQPGPGVQPGQLSDLVWLINATDLTEDDLAAKIGGVEARLKNDNFAPGFVQSPSTQLEQIRSQLELIRLQQLRP